MALRVLEAIDRICLFDGDGGRLRERAPAGLYRAARSMIGGPLCGAAARRLDAVLRPGATVILMTGAGGPAELPHGETDGPPGVAVLARALVLALGARPTVATESRFRGPVLAALDALGRGSGDGGWRGSVRWASFPARRADSRRAALALWARLRPAAVVSVERLGPNRQGVIHDARGTDVTAVHGGLEAIFSLARRRGSLTVGIGDRGNELGFGTVAGVGGVPADLARPCACPCRSTIACAVAADGVVVASVSNWGAYGVVAALAVRHRDPRLLHRRDDEARMLRACVEAGARDGLTGERRLTVDGLSLARQQVVVALLRRVVTRAISA